MAPWDRTAAGDREREGGLFHGVTARPVNRAHESLRIAETSAVASGCASETSLVLEYIKQPYGLEAGAASW